MVLRLWTTPIRETLRGPKLRKSDGAANKTAHMDMHASWLDAYDLACDIV